MKTHFNEVALGVCCIVTRRKRYIRQSYASGAANLFTKYSLDIYFTSDNRQYEGKSLVYDERKWTINKVLTSQIVKNTRVVLGVDIDFPCNLFKGDPEEIKK